MPSKVKARDLVWGWRKPRSTSGPNVNGIGEVARIEAHLAFAEAEKDDDEILRLGMLLHAEAEYRVAQFQAEQMFLAQWPMDPEFKTARTWFTAVAIKMAWDKEQRQRENMEIAMRALRPRDPLAN